MAFGRVRLRLTGGGPGLLGRLYETNWDMDIMMRGLIREGA
ncbi:hypothetical protein [Vulcanisaeta sp. JCM 16161]